ncbi:MAG: integrin alpha [Planctomycetota bacterium]
MTIYSGKDGSVLRAFGGDNAEDLLGHSVGAGGDIDNDGFADVVAGAPQGDPVLGGGPGYGRAFSGKDGSILMTLSGDASSIDFGVAAGGAGDVDQDGFADLIFGDWFDTTAGTEAGAAWVMSGQSGSVLYHPLGPGAVTNFGAAVGGGGDLNRDGAADFVVGGYSGNTAIVYSGKPCPASASNYDSGYPGSNGVPSFTAEDPVICTSITLSLSNSRGVTTAGVILAGLSDAHVPTADGGILLVVPAFVVPVVIPGGGLFAAIDVPCDTAFCGLSVYLQALESDPGAAHGVSFTPGLKMVLGGS